VVVRSRTRFEPVQVEVGCTDDQARCEEKGTLGFV
jgi:hypothetical protein